MIQQRSLFFKDLPIAFHTDRSCLRFTSSRFSIAMAGSSPSPSDKLSAATQSPKVKTTEKKKRKRPSKKVPTTVLESSSTNFMDLVQKLTGSAAEVATKPAPPSLAFSPSLSLATSTTSSSPYSSPSCDYVDPRMSSDAYYQHLLQNAAAATTTTTTTEEDDSSSHGFANPSPMASLYGEEDLYSSYSSSSRATENEISPFSSYNWYPSEMRA